MSVPAPSVTGGIKPWDQAVSAHLPGWTCLWQDLDGLHVAAPPAAAPPTSVLWAWSGDGAMARLRLDGDTVHVAVCAADVPATAVEPWTPTDGRVRAVRFAPDTTAGLQLRLEQAVVAGVDCEAGADCEAGTDCEAGPITFLRPVRP